MFKTRFFYLFPAGAKSLIETSHECVCLLLFMSTANILRGNIPFFDDYLNGHSKAHPFSNCLTLTNNDFTNFQHHHKNFIAIAFGLWWTSTRALTPEGQPVYSFKKGLDYNQIDGGEFLWGEYEIGVDFQW